MVLALRRHRELPQPQRIVGLGLAIAINLALLVLLSLPDARPLPTPATTVEVPPIIVVEVRPLPIVEPQPVPPMPQPPEIRRIESPPVPTPVPPVVVQSTAVPLPPQPAIATPSQPVITEPFAGIGAEVGVAIRRGPPPPYPSIALRRGMQGTVLLRVRVGRDGSVRAVEIAEGSGHAVLDRQAREHVLERWLFHPAQQAGGPVEAWVMLPIEFTLAR